MLKRLFRYKWYIVIIFGLIISEPVVTSWMILWLQKLYNQITIGVPRIEVLKLILGGVLVWICKRLLLFTISVFKSRFICNVKQDLKHDIFASALELNTASIVQIATSGEYISAFTNDITIIEQRFFSNVIGVISKFFNIAILGSTFYSMNRKLAAFMFSFGIIVMIVPPAFSRKLNDANLSYSKHLSMLTQKLKESLLAYGTIKNYSIENIILQKFDAINEDVEDSKFRYDCSLSLADSIGSLLTWFTRIIVIGAGLIMVSSGEILIGTVMAAQALVEELASPLQGIIEDVNAIKSVKSIVSKIYSLTSDCSSQENKPDASFLLTKQNELDVEFRNLTIAINEKAIVKNFSFHFRPGGKYLIVGKNGSGKSSVFKALKKQFVNYNGQILINGIELRSIPSSVLSSLISYLNENVSIFSGSIEENITLWRTISRKKYCDVVRAAHIELDLQRSVGEDGFNISSGEQRRIEIARSLISPTGIMIFDEVVSTLDIETAYEIEKMALDFADKTIIFISHNFSGKLIKQYDEILVLKDGCLVANGSYDALIKSNNYFQRICDIKFGDYYGIET